MSASTGTIQRPAAQGSIFNVVAMAAAALLAATLAWGAINLTAVKVVDTPVPAPALLDKGSRTEIGTPQSVGGQAPAVILDRGGRGDPQTHFPAPRIS